MGKCWSCKKEKPECDAWQFICQECIDAINPEDLIGHKLKGDMK